MKSRLVEQMLLNQVNIPINLLTDYKSLGLNEQDVMVILQIHRFMHRNIDFPTPTELAHYLTIDEKDCATILRKLIQKQLLTIEQQQNEKNLLSESYSLNPLWEKLLDPSSNEEKEEEQNTEGTIFILFEQEFGRPLSPFEIETISDWLDNDNFTPSLIKAALRESVLMGKLNFTYIDRILRNWKQKGIHTVEKARESSRRFRDNQVSRTYETKENESESDKSLYFNWLEGED